MVSRPDAECKRATTALTERDLQVLAFAAEHRLLLAEHVQGLLGVSEAAARARLRRLTRDGFLERRAIFHRQPPFYQVTRRGLAAGGSPYSRPKLDLSCAQHDVGVAWLWLLARAGRFGAVEEVIGERAMRSQDAQPDRAHDPAGVRLGGVGPAGRERVHYPDLVLVLPGGRRVAVELELSAKGRARRERILMGYALDPRVDAVLYLVDRADVARAIRSSAARAGMAGRVHVQPVRWPNGRPQAVIAGHERSAAIKAARER